MSKLIHEAETHQILGACFEVYREQRCRSRSSRPVPGKRGGQPNQLWPRAVDRLGLETCSGRSLSVSSVCSVYSVVIS